MMSDPRADDSLRLARSTSNSLLAGARRGLPAAWERLVRLYAPLVASWCRRWGIAEQDIGDVLQDVFSSVADHIDRFRHDRPQDTFRGWLLTIARNKVRDDCRRRAAEPAADGGTEGLLRMQRIPDVDKTIETFESSADGQADGSPLNRLLQAALETIRGEFHERTWRAFWAVAVDGRSTADVAADLGMTQGAVRVAKSRVLLRLRRELGDLPEPLH